MLNKLVLTNFGLHESLTVDFATGMNVLRGANEAGKSTIYSAVLYALWGARAIPLSLDDTVTWGKSASVLAVDLELTIEGIDYVIRRTKAGATLSGSNGVTVNGQAEVSKFVSGLFKADMNTAQAVLVVGQDGIREGLSGGTDTLIETLANMSLIDNLITSVGTHRSSGNTKQQELRLMELQTATATAPVADFAAQQEVLISATAAHETAKALAAVARAASEGSAEAVSAAQATISQAQATATARQRAEAQRAALAGQIAAFVEPEGADADSLLSKAEAQEAAKAIGTQYAAFLKIPAAARAYDSAELFEADVALWKGQLASTQAAIQNYRVEIAQAKAMAINDESCALCGKMLADVPEVVQVNARASAKVMQLEGLLVTETAKLAVAEQSVKALAVLAATDHSIKLAAAAVKSDYLGRVVGFPSLYEWIGPQPQPKDPVNWRAEYNAAKAKQAAGAAEVARQAAVRAQLAQVEAQLADPVVDFDVAGAKVVLDQAKLVSAALNQANDELTAAANAKHTAEMNLATVQAQHAAKVATFEKAVQDRDAMQALVAEMNANNAIIKKLRDARPIVTKKVWSLVLHLVSEYFSQIRGTISVVTRGDSGFLVDGKPLGAFSGSTKDSLGLARRIALQKVFLPAVDFMLVDEAAKGMDDNREIAMLGAMSACGFTQTVVVTHSPVADTFANHLIEI